MPPLLQGINLEPGLMRCCHPPCESRPVDHPVNICNKLLLDIRRHIKKYYSVSICVHFLPMPVFASLNHRLAFIETHAQKNNLFLDQQMDFTWSPVVGFCVLDSSYHLFLFSLCHLGCLTHEDTNKTGVV